MLAAWIARGLALVSLVNPTFLFSDISAASASAPHRLRSRVGLSVTSDTMRTARVRPRHRMTADSPTSPERARFARVRSRREMLFVVHFTFITNGSKCARGVDARASR